MDVKKVKKSICVSSKMLKSYYVIVNIYLVFTSNSVCLSTYKRKFKQQSNSCLEMLKPTKQTCFFIKLFIIFS